MNPKIFGWDLLYNSVEKDIKRNEEILICLAHLVLISNDFRCIGAGESKYMDGTETTTESLPPGWNIKYAIRYVHQGRLYLFKATIIKDIFIINLVRQDENRAAVIEMNVKQVVTKKGTLDEMIPDNKNIIEEIKEKLIDNLVQSTRTKDCECQTEEPYKTEFPGSNPISTRDLVDLRNQRPNQNMQNVPYGQADLHPFPNLYTPPRLFSPYLGGGGGMIFDPDITTRHIGNRAGVPPGSVPPGARFDPIGPSGIGIPPRRRPNWPDNDEFPPPGFDDMFN